MMKLNKCVSILLLLMLMAQSLVGCDTATFKQVEAKANNVAASMYVPNDAVQLDRNVRTGHKEYVAPNCVVSYTELIYGINRSLETVVNEYYTVLTKENWELNPSYKPNKTARDVYLRQGVQITLEIYSISDPGRSPLTKVKPENTPYKTLYAVVITYSEPSSEQCRV